MISLLMISEWFQRVGSSVPRGFSRYFILELLKKNAPDFYKDYVKKYKKTVEKKQARRLGGQGDMFELPV